MYATTSKDDLEFRFFLQKMQEQSMRCKVLLIESVSIFLTVISSMLTSYLAYVDMSVAALAIAIDSLLDILAYLVVIWRYIRSEEVTSEKRDSRASLCLSLLFILSSICIAIESSRHLYYLEKPVPHQLYVMASVIASVTFSLVSIIKFYIAQQLIANSSALATSGINSLICSLSYLSMAISMSVFLLSPKIWYLDSLFGLAISFLIFVYGVNLFFKFSWKLDK